MPRSGSRSACSARRRHRRGWRCSDSGRSEQGRTGRREQAPMSVGVCAAMVWRAVCSLLYSPAAGAHTPNRHGATRRGDRSAATAPAAATRAALRLLPRPQVGASPRAGRGAGQERGVLQDLDRCAVSGSGWAGRRGGKGGGRTDLADHLVKDLRDPLVRLGAGLQEEHPTRTRPRFALALGHLPVVPLVGGAGRERGWSVG